MITVSIANQKGGEGKTTTSLNLAIGLARRNQRTLLVDMDPQANSTSIFVNPNSSRTNLFHVFGGKAKMSEIVIPVYNDFLFLAPSSRGLAEIETLSANSVEAPYVLREALAPVEEKYDFCIIDCPPSLSRFTVNALVASDFVIVPLQAEKFSIEGIVGLQETISSIQKRINPSLEILGALITQLKPQTILTKTIVPTINKYFKIFENSISDGVAVGESHLAKMSVFDYNKGSRQAQEYEGFVDEVLNELKK
jgi:chromosome partitioning protein